jgi:hypothetical protein
VVLVLAAVFASLIGTIAVRPLLRRWIAEARRAGGTLPRTKTVSPSFASPHVGG